MNVRKNKLFCLDSSTILKFHSKRDVDSHKNLPQTCVLLKTKLCIHYKKNHIHYNLSFLSDRSEAWYKF